MKTRTLAKRFVYVLTVCALLSSLVFGGAAVSYADSPVSFDRENVKLMGACEAAIDGNKLTITDTDFNNDVWSSKFLIETGMQFTPGETYTISVDLAGDNGVGEFFLCKGENIDLRYDETFISEPGSRTITFTPIQSKVFIGMQVGNLGVDNSVTATVTNLSKLSESSSPALLRTENCAAEIKDGVITATDTGDNNDVWNSKLLYDTGRTLEIGETYKLSFDLAGDNGVGEFFVCKSQDLNDRYDSTFANHAGTNNVIFKAESDRLLIGMQFGNLGKGNAVTARIGEVGPFFPVDDPPEIPPESVNCFFTVDGNRITVTDMGASNDVWDSRVLYDAGIELEEGKEYEIRFSLSGDNGVGEFFLCKSRDIDNRYDETFSNAPGQRTVVFTAAGSTAYVGMQVGNVGAGNSVTLTIDEVKEYDEDEQKQPRMLTAENCSYEVESGEDWTQIRAVDTGENNDVWNSKILYFLGEILEKGRIYAANFNLSGDNGVGEFFFCKKDSLDERYSFDNTAGDHTAKFQAEDEKLYAGMQFGDVGVGNEVTLRIDDIFRIPGMQKSGENCTENLAQDAITLTDTDDNNDVWTSKAVFDTGIVLEPGKTYTATFTLSGDNGVGEFFFLKDDNIDHRYSFDNESGTHTVTFTAEDAALYFGMQCGNLGSGNSVTVSDITVTPVEDEQTASAFLAEPAEAPDAEVPAVEVPPVEVPVGEVPPVEVPVGEVPPVEVPVEEVPAGEAE